MRTRSEVLAARKRAVQGGCCDRFADNMGCSCLATAEPDDPGAGYHDIMAIAPQIREYGRGYETWCYYRHQFPASFWDVLCDGNGREYHHAEYESEAHAEKMKALAANKWLSQRAGQPYRRVLTSDGRRVLAALGLAPKLEE